MGWNNTTKIMTAPVGMGDIQAAVNYPSSLDLGTLISNGAITKWAKYKPIVHTTGGILTEAERKTKDQGFVNICYTSDMLACFNRALATMADWEYQRPSGTIGVAPYRMLDFVPPTLSGNGYNKNAKRPFEISAPSNVTDSGQTTAADYQLMWQYSVQEISLLDLASFGDSYDASSGWNWVVLYRLPGESTSTVHSAYLKTEKGGSTNVKAAAPSASSPTLRGFFRITGIGSLTSGIVKAVLALESSAIPHKYLYVASGSLDTNHPGISFDFTNPAADLVGSWVWNAAQSGQPYPYKRGLEATLTISPSGTTYYATWATRLKIQVPSSDFVSGTAIKVRIGMQGYENGSYGAVFYNTVTVNPNAGATIFVDNALPGTGSTCVTENFDDMRVSIQITIGTQTPFYLDPIQAGDQTGRMGKTSYEMWRTIREIRQYMGANATSFIHSNLDS